MDGLKLSLIRYDKDDKYICNLDDQDSEQIKQNIKSLLLGFAKLRPYMAFYKMQIKAHNITPHHMLKNEVDLILPKFYESHKSKRGIFGTLISDFIGLASEGISSFCIIKDIMLCIKQLKPCLFQWMQKEVNLCHR